MTGFLDVRADIKPVTRWLSDIERRQMPFATALALTRTAQHVQKKTLPRVLPRVFDRPTRFTLRGFFIIPAKKNKLQASVQIQEFIKFNPDRAVPSAIGTPPFEYLQYQISGGSRRAKSHERQLRRVGILGPNEFTVPGNKMRLNRFGNLTGATYSKILADVQGSDVGIPQGFGQSTTKVGKKRFFYDPNKRPRGIYQRTSRRKIKLALLFVDSPRYKKRFDFDGIVRRVAVKRFPIEFEKAMRRALATDLSRGPIRPV